MNWYLKRMDGEVYGPVGLPTLQLWAMDGRVAPDDKISMDQRTWEPAFDLAELSMEWKVELGDGSAYGPIHLLALRDLIHDGSISLGTKIKHKQSGEERVVCEALLLELIKTESKAQAEVGALTERLGDAEKRMGELQQELQNASEIEGKLRDEIKTLTAKQKVNAPAAGAPTTEIQKLREQADKWKNLHEQAVAQLAQMKSRQVADQPSGGDTVPRARFEDAERKLFQIERHYQQLLKTLNRSFGARAAGRPVPQADNFQRRDVS